MMLWGAEMRKVRILTNVQGVEVRYYPGSKAHIKQKACEDLTQSFDKSYFVISVPYRSGYVNDIWHA